MELSEIGKGGFNFNNGSLKLFLGIVIGPVKIKTNVLVMVFGKMPGFHSIFLLDSKRGRVFFSVAFDIIANFIDIIKAGVWKLYISPGGLDKWVFVIFFGSMAA